MISVDLKPPKIQGNKIFLSWEPCILFKEAGYHIEYLNLTEINTSPQALLEAYLPVCLAFCALGEVEINFPYHFDDRVLGVWEKVFKDTSKKLFRNPFGVKFNNPPIDGVSSIVTRGIETALLFGGGSESLLTLSYLLDKGISPYLVSGWGSNWSGSDLNLNRDRYDQEERISSEFNLRMFRICSNFRDLTTKCNFYPYLSKKVYFLNAVLFLPLNLSLLFPIAQQLGLKQVVSGNEKESSDDVGFYSLSREMTCNLKSCSMYVEYFSYLETIKKIEVVKNLHLQYSKVGKYQCSCFFAKNQRWCLKCEKCLRNFIIFKIYGINPTDIGMDEQKIKQNMDSDLLMIYRVGWEIVHNIAVRREWESIRIEAIKNNNKEVCDIISRIYKKYTLRKIYNFFNNIRTLLKDICRNK